MFISIVIRTYNESLHLQELLSKIKEQNYPKEMIEVVIVDSGSTDNTLEIAKANDCNITHIKKEEFTFGKSLNIGCDYAKGDILVFVSGHCIPVNNEWLSELIMPLKNGIASYSYGRQIGSRETKFSEKQVFKKYYPEKSKVTQKDFFCNNANAAILRSVWQKNRFCEKLTGLEDMDLAKRLIEQEMKMSYVANASVHHIHNESWQQIKTRYEREAVALQKIMPEIHISFIDFLRYFISAVFHDSLAAKNESKVLYAIKEIVLFRFMHFWGAYKGNNDHKKTSSKTKDRYFYPKN